MSNNDWYRYYAPRRLAELTPERIARDRAAAERDLDALLARSELRFEDRILEIGCGWGRHALALAARGFGRVTSVDIAPEPLALACALASEAGLRCHVWTNHELENYLIVATAMSRLSGLNVSDIELMIDKECERLKKDTIAVGVKYWSEHRSSRRSRALAIAGGRHLADVECGGRQQPGLLPGSRR